MLHSIYRGSRSSYFRILVSALRHVLLLPPTPCRLHSMSCISHWSYIVLNWRSGMLCTGARGINFPKLPTGMVEG